MRPNERRLRVLVVEDDADTRANLRDILESDGCAVDLAGDLRSGIARLDRDPDVVLLDRHLPDGAADAHLDRFVQGAPRAALVLVTARLSEEELQVATAAGVAHHVPKPVDVELLRNILHRLRPRRPEEGRRNELPRGTGTYG